MTQQLATRTPMQDALARVTGDDFKTRLENALPEKVSVKRFQSIAATAIRQNPGVIVDPDSLFTSLVRCAQDGLMPDGREAALVVYKVKGQDKVQYLPMISGLRKRLAEHGFDLTAYVVYERDGFDYELGNEPWVKHKPAKLGTDRGKAIGAYAVAEDMRTHKRYVDVMSVEEIEKVRAVSRAATSEYGPWVKWWAEQARKTVGRRLAKTLPLADPEAVAALFSSIDAEYDLPAVEQTMTEREANTKAVSASLPEPTPEDTRVREEPAPDRPDEAQLNRLALLARDYEGDVSVYLIGAFNAASFEELTSAQATQAEAALRRLVESQAVEGEYTEPPAEAETKAEPASFDALLPEDVKKAQREGRSG